MKSASSQRGRGHWTVRCPGSQGQEGLKEALVGSREAGEQGQRMAAGLAAGPQRELRGSQPWHHSRLTQEL